MINKEDFWRFPRCSKIDILHDGHAEIICCGLGDSRTCVERNNDDWLMYDEKEALLVRVSSYPLKLFMYLYSIFTKVGLVLVLLFGLVSVARADDPMGKVEIPVLNVKERIYYAPIENRQWNPEYWEDNVAFLEGTAWISQGAYNTVLVSHNTGPLADIGDLVPGDKIYVADRDYKAEYIVSSKWVTDYKDLEPVQPTDTPTLTLIICWSDTERLIVRADRTYLKHLGD